MREAVAWSGGVGMGGGTQICTHGAAAHAILRRIKCAQEGIVSVVTLFSLEAVQGTEWSKGRGNDWARQWRSME